MFRFVGGGHTTFCGFLNMGVHIIMYFYYFMSAMGPGVQKYLWWKRYNFKYYTSTSSTFIDFFQIPDHSSDGSICDIFCSCLLSSVYWMWFPKNLQLCHTFSWSSIFCPLCQFLHPGLHKEGKKEGSWS